MKTTKLTLDEFLKEESDKGNLFLSAGEPVLTVSNWSSPIKKETEQEGSEMSEEDKADTDDEEEEDEYDSDDAETNDTGRTVDLMITTRNTDRKGHILEPGGMELKNYQLNPVFMWNHLGYTDPSAIIGKALSITQHDKYVTARVQYAKLKHNKLPDKLFELERKGLLPGNSVGIRPLGKIRKREDGNIIIGHYDLMDISKVALGQNPKAVNKLI